MRPYRPTQNDPAYHPAMVTMFDHISRKYDLINRLMSLGIDTWWRKRMVRGMQGVILDSCAGTGDVSFLLVEQGCDVFAVDASEGMLRRAQERDTADRVAWCIGDCTRLPLPDEGFDCVTMSFGIRNIADRVGALRELHRVTKPGGEIRVLEAMPHPNRAWRWVMSTYQRVFFPIWGRIIGYRRSAYVHLVRTIAGFGTVEEFEAELSAAGWRPVNTRWMTGGGAVLFRAVRG